MNELNFDAMSRDQLAHYMVAYRNTPEEIEARKVYIQRMAEKAKSRGIKFYRNEIQE